MAAITVEITAQGLLIPRAAIREWLEAGEIEAIKDQDRLIIQPKPAPLTEREQILQILAASGLLIKPDWPPLSPPVSPEERAELAKKLSVGRPLSELLLEEREAGW